MDIFSCLAVAGGIALFLYGMNIMGSGLTGFAGGRLENLLEKMTDTGLKAVIFGTLVTAVIQSSSATTAMVVNLVDSGIMRLERAVGVIMGANIGTTVTSWILSLSGISSDNVWISLLRPESLAPVLATAGVVIAMTAHDIKKINIGNICIGFALLMYGMEIMSVALSPLAADNRFREFLVMFSNPVMGVVAGTVVTTAIQSSSASVGILQSLCMTGAISYGCAIPIIMGQNIGTCVTAIISTIGTNINAKRAAMIHLYFNLIGTIIFMVVFYGMNSIIGFGFLEQTVSAYDIALIHTLFNIGGVAALYPFSKLLVRLSVITVTEGIRWRKKDSKKSFGKR